MKKLIPIFVLTILLVTPALPAWADGGPAASWLGWFQGWLDGALSWVTGEEGAKIDPNGDHLESAGSEEGAKIDPNGLTDGQSSDDGDVGSQIDPAG